MPERRAIGCSACKQSFNNHISTPLFWVATVFWKAGKTLLVLVASSGWFRGIFSLEYAVAYSRENDHTFYLGVAIKTKKMMPPFQLSLAF